MTQRRPGERKYVTSSSSLEFLRLPASATLHYCHPLGLICYCTMFILFIRPVSLKKSDILLLSLPLHTLEYYLLLFMLIAFSLFQLT